MRTLRVNIPQREYEIYIGGGLLGRAAELIGGLVAGKKAAVITDGNVAPLYGEAILRGLSLAGARPFTVEVEAGEGSKSLAVFERVCSQIMQNGFSRSDCVVALGGGVVGDLAGFVASTVLRGVRLIQIPTTLLSQVDSSVGGKTAVNLPEGKNLVGTFYQPSAVLIDTDTLKTLPEREVSCGMAEIIKYAAIRDAEMGERLLRGDYEIEDIIARCCAIKAKIVEADERDTGERMLLNFGHTVGHAVENRLGYGAISHGAAVAIGMCVITEYAERAGLTDVGTLDTIKLLCEKYGLPTAFDDREGLIAAAGHDKKRSGDSIGVVLVRRMGEGYCHKTDMDGLEAIIRGE